MAQLDDAALMTRPTAVLAGLSSRALMIAAVGIIAAIAGYFAAGAQFWASYLIGYIFWIGITIGSLAVLMVQHLTGGKWTMSSRRLLEASTGNIPLMAVLFIPILLNASKIFPWWSPKPDDEAMQEVLHLKGSYLNPAFFTARAALYFAIWAGLAYFLNKWSRQQDAQPTQLPGPLDRRSRVLSGPGLVLYVTTITFMSVDWIMSLDPAWFSTIFGILTLGGQGLSTMAFTILMLAILVQHEPMSRVADAETFHDHGKLMFAFIMLWAYFSISQLLIIWSANLPEEVKFYMHRGLKPEGGPWFPVSVALLVGQFALPFLILLSQKIKRNPNQVKWVAAFILVMRVIDITWTVGPIFRHDNSGISWVDFAAVLAIGGIWLFMFFRNLAGRAIVPARDPYFKEALAHGGH